MDSEMEGMDYSNTDCLGTESVQLPIYDEGLYPNSPKPDHGDEMALKDAPGFINGKLSEAVRNGNFHEVMSHYVGVASCSGAVDEPTIEQFRSLAQEAWANRFDPEATKTTFKKVSELIGSLKPIRRR